MRRELLLLDEMIDAAEQAGPEMSPGPEPLRTLTTHGHQSLVTGGGLNWAALYAYSQGAFRSLRR